VAQYIGWNRNKNGYFFRSEETAIIELMCDEKGGASWEKIGLISLMDNPISKR
jgi:hypothetical protein